MDSIDRLGWAVGVSVLVHGVRFGIRAKNEAALNFLLSLLPAGWKVSSRSVVERLYSVVLPSFEADLSQKSSAIRRFNLLYANHQRVARSEVAADVTESFKTDVQLFVAEHAPHRVFVHAGVVGWQGRAIVIPGRSFSGKSTLTAALVRAGATYYSDEYAVLDKAGRVYPYNKPISLREEGSQYATEYPLSTFGGRAGKTPLPIGLVLISSFKAGALWRPRQLSAGRGVLMLLENTVSARRAPQLALATLQRAVANATIVQSARGEADEIAPLILGGIGKPKADLKLLCN